MKIGVTIPNHWGVQDVREVLALGRLAEQLGFASVWTMDHLLNVARIRERLDDRPFWHPLAILSSLAAVTERVQLGTSVLVLPYHEPVGLAKYAATLDHLCGGRLLLGVGVGALRPEFEALGVPMRRRGAMTDESIDVMRHLWTCPEPSYHAGRFQLADLRFSPRPLRSPNMPLWIGGASAAAIARTARVGDGWHPANIALDDFRRGCERVRELAAESGRDPARIEMSIRLDVDPDGEPTPARLAALVQELDGFADAGCQHALLALTSGSVDKLRVWMHALAAEVVPALA